MKKITTMILLLLLSSQAFAATVSPTYYIHGTIVNVTSGEAGLMIMIKDSSGNLIVPSNAPNTPYGWLLIPQEYQTMITVALLCWRENRKVTVYCKGTTTGNDNTGYALLNQIDPVEQ